MLCIEFLQERGLWWLDILRIFHNIIASQAGRIEVQRNRTSSSFTTPQKMVRRRCFES
jgi:hypothetical protein